MDIVGVYNYYPFGQLIENRTWEGSSARFGFQGQERDDEIAGKGNSLHYTARDYSTQTARMDRIDPLSDKFPSQSPYVTSGNSPISMIDREGKSGKPVLDREAGTYTVQSKIYFYGSKATSERSKKIATDIASQWNGTNTQVTQGGTSYDVKFKISYETITEAEALELSVNNTDPVINFMRVEDGGTKSSISIAYPEHGTNSFWININDGNTTTSHEWGHGYGLIHTLGSSHRTERPDIMIPRGATYGSQYSIPGVSSLLGATRYTVNPNSRRVNTTNVVDALNAGCGQNDVMNAILDQSGTKYTVDGGTSWNTLQD